MSNIIEITDFPAPGPDVYARLTEVQLLNRGMVCAMPRPRLPSVEEVCAVAFRQLGAQD